MFKFVYGTEEFENNLHMEKGTLYCDDAIVKIVLANDLRPDWNYKNAKLCAVATLHAGKFVIYIAESDDDSYFKNDVAKEFTEHNLVYHSANEDADKAIFGHAIGLDLTIRPVRVIKGKGWTIDKHFRILIEKGLYKGDFIKDIYGGESFKAMHEFADWKKDNEPQHIFNITSHCLAALMKNVIIHNHREWFFDNYKTDKKGFFIG